jgi:hypothetical protein
MLDQLSDRRLHWSVALLLQLRECRWDGNPHGRDLSPAVASDSIGNFVVVWQGSGGQDGSDWGVFGQRFNASGLPQGGECHGVRALFVTVGVSGSMCQQNMPPRADYSRATLPPSSTDPLRLMFLLLPRMWTSQAGSPSQTLPMRASIRSRRAFSSHS